MTAVIAIGLSTAAAFFLARSGIGLRPRDIALLARTKFNHNDSVLQSLSKQRADTEVGICLLIIATGVQFAGMTPTLQRRSMAAPEPLWLGLAIASSIIALAEWSSRLRFKRIAKAARLALEDPKWNGRDPSPNPSLQRTPPG